MADGADQYLNLWLTHSDFNPGRPWQASSTIRGLDSLSFGLVCFELTCMRDGKAMGRKEQVGRCRNADQQSFSHKWMIWCGGVLIFIEGSWEDCLLL